VLRRVLVALALFVLAAPVGAQVSGSVSALSDYRYRGASLTDGKPALQVHLGYDFVAGSYAGVLVSNARGDDREGSELLTLVYLGKAWPLRGGWHWEVGAQYTAFARSGEYDHPELYAGIGLQRAGVRLHYSDNYFGRWPGWYLEYDARHPLSEHWHLVAHAGMLRTNGGAASAYRRDWSAGFGLTRSGYEWQLLWIAATGGPLHGYSTPGYGEDEGPVLRLAYSW
jgi:uncharacterized protein (TIGR02001 family)